jgi:hypothetical protein
MTFFLINVELRQDCYWRKKESNRYTECSPNSNWMESVLGMNISLDNRSDTLHNRQGFKTVSTDCHETPEMSVRISEPAFAVICVSCICNTCICRPLCLGYAMSQNVRE